MKNYSPNIETRPEYLLPAPSPVKLLQSSILDSQLLSQINQTMITTLSAYDQGTIAEYCKHCIEILDFQI